MTLTCYAKKGIQTRLRSSLDSGSQLIAFYVQSHRLVKVKGHGI